MIDFCPKLETKRVTLHPLHRDHAADLFPILSDAELWQHTEKSPPNTLAGLYQRYTRLETRTSDDGQQHWLNWAIEEKNGSRLIGFVQATVDKTLSEAEIAYLLGRSAWGRGLAWDSVRQMLTFLREIAVTTIKASVDSRNLRSIRLLHRLGFLANETADARTLVFIAPAHQNTLPEEGDLWEHTRTTEHISMHAGNKREAGR